VRRGVSPSSRPRSSAIYALQQRRWTDADLTPAEVDAGVTVAHKVWEFGDIAPGCANERGTAIFPDRVGEVCTGLNIVDDPRTPDLDEFVPRCCIESICDDEYGVAVRCLTSLDSGGFFPKG
jgi:hypothetical protein